MNLSRVRAHPIAYWNQINPVNPEGELEELLPYLQGNVQEIFCRDGSLGRYLLERGVQWSGTDRDGTMLEHAFLQGVFSVSCSEYPKPGSCDVIFGAFAPFSYIAPAALQDFASAIHASLSPGGTSFFELWESPDAISRQALMETYNGTTKLVRACVPVVEKEKAIFDIEWMIAEPKQQPRYEHHRETRYLHSKVDIFSAFSWGEVQELTIADRSWLRIDKPNFE